MTAGETIWSPLYHEQQQLSHRLYGRKLQSEPISLFIIRCMINVIPPDQAPKSYLMGLKYDPTPKSYLTSKFDVVFDILFDDIILMSYLTLYLTIHDVKIDVLFDVILDALYDNTIIRPDVLFDALATYVVSYYTP